MADPSNKGIINVSEYIEREDFTKEFSPARKSYYTGEED